MRIAVFSDTHNSYPPTLPEQIKDADELWHLGDVCDPAVLEEIGLLGPPLYVIQGNCDVHSAWPASLTLEREGVRFYLTHIPPALAPKGVDVVLHGHIHVPRDEMMDGVRWLNPGSISEPRRGQPASFAWLTVKQGQVVSWEVVSV